MSLEENVFKLVAEQLGVKQEDVTRDKRFEDDLGADSLDLVELVLAVGETFGVDISDEDAEKIKTAGDVINFVKINGGDE